MISNIINNVSRLNFIPKEQKLVIYYKDDSIKEMDMTTEEWDNVIKGGDFSKIINNG